MSDDLIGALGAVILVGVIAAFAMGGFVAGITATALVVAGSTA
jgi:hypothetical protein